MKGGGHKKTEMPLMLYPNQEVPVAMAMDRRPVFFAKKYKSDFVILLNTKSGQIKSIDLMLVCCYLSSVLPLHFLI